MANQSIKLSPLLGGSTRSEASIEGVVDFTLPGFVSGQLISSVGQLQISRGNH